VVIASAGTLMENCPLAVMGGVSESATCKVKVTVPVAFGVPEITPVLGARVAQAGSDPEEMLQV
jgi:hypothetical protein